MSIKVTLVKENRKTFTIKEESLRIKSLKIKALIPKEILSHSDMYALRELETHPERLESINESIIGHINKHGRLPNVLKYYVNFKRAPSKEEMKELHRQIEERKESNQ